MKILEPWQLWIYRIGVVGSCFSLFGLIIIGTRSNINWDDDILKTKTNKLSDGVEHVFYVLGFVYVVILIIAFFSFVFGNV